MLQGWITFIACLSILTPALTQSGDGEWGSGVEHYSAIISSNGTTETLGDDPGKGKSNHRLTTSPSSLPSPPPSLHHEPHPDECSLHLSTGAAVPARWLKEVTRLQTLQHGVQAVVENLEQFVSAELGDQSYGDVIRENIIGIQEDHKSCNEELERAEVGFTSQLEGDSFGSLTLRKKIKEESQVFEDLLRSAADIASRLERSSQALHASFTQQLKHTVKIHQ